MIFYLGTHQPGWLGWLDVPLFVSRARLHQRRSMPRARAPWALDSGGFTELSIHGRWTVTEADYAAEICRYADEIGRLSWAAPQDWMCESHVLHKTGLTVREHQARTIASVLGLRGRGVDVVPVLQGWGLDDYERHVDAYATAGIDLAREAVVGVGTICRRQSTGDASRIVRALASKGLRLHAFGAKVSGLRLYADRLVSADSMAWSYAARVRKLRLPGCEHLNCGNCERWALRWRDEVIASMIKPIMPLFHMDQGRGGAPARERGRGAEPLAPQDTEDSPLDGTGGR